MVKSNFSKIEIKILKDLGNKNEVFLQLGSVRPFVRDSWVQLKIDLSSSNFQGLFFKQLATLWKAKQLYNQYPNVSLSILNITILAFLIN